MLEGRGLGRALGGLSGWGVVVGAVVEVLIVVRVELLGQVLGLAPVWGLRPGLVLVLVVLVVRNS